MSTGDEDGYSQFVQAHKPQLTISGVPEHFWYSLFMKLKNEVLDAGKYFSMICQTDDDDSSIEDLSTVGDYGAKNGKNDGAKEQETNEPPQKRSSLENVRDYGDVRSPCSFIKSSRFLRKHATGNRWRIVVSNEDGVEADDPNCIFLVDHAWTYMAADARKQLELTPRLLRRMSALMDIETDGLSEEVQIQIVLKWMWRYNQTYSVQNPDLTIEEKMPVWYIMDEFGSRVGHSADPNVRMVPFYYVPHRISYTLMFPIKDIATGDVVTRDYVAGASYRRSDWRSYYILPWVHADLSRLPYDFILPEDSFFTEGRNDERLLDSPIALSPSHDSKEKKLRVYSEYSKVTDHLKHRRFEITNSEDHADVLWLHKHFKDYRTLFERRPQILINQVPFESVLTVKDLLAAAVHSWYERRVASADKRPTIDHDTLDSRPSWLATTYNLKTELPQFVSYFQNRKKLGLDNHWIIKPWNLARGLDTSVTSDLGQIIRLIESGPKIASKYLEDPVLFYRDDINDWVKFDMRFIVLLRSVKPLKVYVYDRFWLRFALKAFSMDSLDDYEKHFTVFNYLDSSKIKQMFSKDFIGQFLNQYPHCNWDDVIKRIYASFKELFEIACGEQPPRGLAPYPQCRAMYGLDVMLKWAVDEKGEKVMHPVILEVNFTPDCARACDYYPDFMDTVFETLFLDEVGKDLPVTLI